MLLFGNKKLYKLASVYVSQPTDRWVGCVGWGVGGWLAVFDTTSVYFLYNSEFWKFYFYFKLWYLRFLIFQFYKFSC